MRIWKMRIFPSLKKRICQGPAVSEKVHLRSDFKKKYSGQKFFVRFLVQMKTTKSPFEIN